MTAMMMTTMITKHLSSNRDEESRAEPLVWPSECSALHLAQTETITSSKYDKNILGRKNIFLHCSFANDDGSSRQEVGAPDAIRGSYSFVTPEGEQVNVQYHADETGFHATGSHVPQAPPMPAHVQRLLDHLAKVNGLERL